MDRSVSRRKMVLVVADSVARNRDRLSAIFSGRGAAGQFDVRSVATGDAAMEEFSRAHPDLLLINIDVGGLSARRICEEIRRTEGNRHTGIVFLVSDAAAEDELAVECLELGADDVIDASAKGAVIAARVKSVLRLKAMTDELRSANHQLRVLSLTDDLTGLPNMRCFNQKFTGAVDDCRVGKSGLAVMMLDLDHFKSVNDTSNHLVGSHVLAELGKAIRQCRALEEKDVVARYGGDEFVTYMPADSLDVARAKAEAVRTAIADTKVSHDGVVVRLTASIGVAWVTPGFRERAEDLIKAADLMLYRSKAAGRNCVSAIELIAGMNLDAAPTRTPVRLAPAVEAAAEGDEEDVGVARLKRIG